jgi:hypothetical protein
MKSVVVIISDKLIEINAIYIVMAADNDDQRKMLVDAGWPQGPERYFPGGILIDLNSYEAQSRRRLWTTRTMRVAHEFLDKHYQTIRDGDIIDIQYILKETTSPKKREKNGND